MASSIICPFCLRKNEPDAGLCAYCGVSLSSATGEERTTRQISTIYSLPLQSQNRCLELPSDLQVGDMALFILNIQEPIIVQRGKQMTLGRFSEDSPVNLIDLTPYGAIERGVSRQHALIKVEEGGGVVVDLGSTNGTWLNRERLVPGKSYKVQSGDGIWLGHLKMTPCLYTGERSRETVFRLQTPEPRRPLTAAFLTTTVAPFLEAMTAVQQVCDAIKKRQPAEMAILSLSAANMGRDIIVHISGADEAVRLVGKWAEAVKSAVSRESLAGLVTEMAAELSPDLSENDRQRYRDQLFPPIEALAANPLILIPREQEPSRANERPGLEKQRD